MLLGKRNFDSTLLFDYIIITYNFFFPHGSHVFVNAHKFKSSEIILPNAEDYFPVFSIC